jgi:hypothetical protein
MVGTAQERLWPPCFHAQQMRRADFNISNSGRHTFAFPRAIAPELCVIHVPQKSRGHREGRVAGRTHGPPATKKAGGSYHRSSQSTGLPCAMVLTVSFVLSSGTGLSCPRRALRSQRLCAWPQRREAGTTPLRRPSRHRSSGDTATSIASRAPRS